MRAMKTRRKKPSEGFRRAVARRHTAIDPETKIRVDLQINSWLQDPKVIEAFERAIANADPGVTHVEVEPLEKFTRVIEIDGARDLWKKTDDPRWVWIAIQDRAHHRKPFPDWILEYLDKCARGVLRAKGDRGRELLPALGFSAKSGRKRNSNADLLSEQFAMAFAAEIFRGSSAGKARKKAAERYGHWKDDKDRKRRLKEFFELKALAAQGHRQGEKLAGATWPKTQLEWKLIVCRWLQLHPWYTERYPDLPTQFDF
jgi:hypothetical protein